METDFDWIRRIRPGYELVKMKIDWNVRVPFLQTTYGDGKLIHSPNFTSKESPEGKWRLELFDYAMRISIYVYHQNYVGKCNTFTNPILVKMTMRNGKGQKVLQQIISCKPVRVDSNIQFRLTKEDIIRSDCLLSDGSCTFCFRILSHVKKMPSISYIHPETVAINCIDGLVTQLEKLFEGMPLSDVKFFIQGRELPAHKSILIARSEVFEAMFEHPTRENLTNLIVIEDIEPEVFYQLLHFIYTGQVALDKMETMAAGLYIAADKYLLEELKMECGNYLLHHMSPDNCVLLLLYGDLLNLVETFKEAAKYFLRFPLEVMATDGWKRAKQENPVALVAIHEFIYQNKML
jgi:speckle-type POZ protein